MKKHLLLLATAMMMVFSVATAQNQTVSLDGSWDLSYGLCDENAPQTPDDFKAAGWPTITATVPGNVELDMIAAGKLQADWEKGAGIYKLRELEPYQWWFHRTFATPEYKDGERVEIVFEGIDCYSKIWVNNQLIAETDNMLRPYRFDITDALNASGNNDIYVRINPAVLEARKIFNSAVGKRRYMRAEQEYIRKAPHMYGWDIMPRAVSAGFWRSVSLEVKKTNQFDNIFWMTDKIDREKKTADLLLDWQISTDYLNIDGLYIEIEIAKDGKKVFSRKEAIYAFCGRQRLTLENVEYWWPRGYGDPVLYDTKIRLIDDKNKVLDERESKLGIRTVDLIRTETSTHENPGCFYFNVNGVPVFVRGINWSPTSIFHSKDLELLPQTFDLVLQLNCNLIRCWGGSVYESDEFYRLCNENGVMVWQDFSFACTAYPQDKDFAQKVREEAIQTIIRLRNNPSLVLYCGNNENDISIEANFKKSMDPNYDVISRDILRRAIWEYDPIRDYLPSSPYISPEGFKLDPNGSMPMTHLWGERGWFKAPYYANTQAHFCAEIGYQGCPSRSTLEKTVDAEYVYPWTADGKWNEQWMIHSVRPHPDFHGADGRNDWMLTQPVFLFGEPKTKDLDEFIARSQFTHCEAMKFFVETFRMGRPVKSGIVLWNLREGWPTFSEALVDYYYQKKPGFYYITRVYQNTCVMVGEPVNGMHPVVVDNETLEPKTGKITIRDAENDKVIYNSSFNVPANSNMTVGFLPDQEQQTMWIIEYTVDGQKDKLMNHYLVGQPPFNVTDYERWFNKLGVPREK